MLSSRKPTGQALSFPGPNKKLSAHVSGRKVFVGAEKAASPFKRRIITVRMKVF